MALAPAASRDGQPHGLAGASWHDRTVPYTNFFPYTSFLPYTNLFLGSVTIAGPLTGPLFVDLSVALGA